MKYSIYKFIRSILAKIAVLSIWYNFILVAIGGINSIGEGIYLFFYAITIAALADRVFHISEIIRKRIKTLKRN